MSYIKNLICRQGNFTLDVPSMEWPEGRISALVGPSGSGKSSFALALCGLKPVEKGFEWIFKGQNLALLSPPERKISLLFQTLELFPHLSVEKNILFPAQAQKISYKKTQERFLMLKEYLQLSSFLKNPVYALSGGEKQRVALARALVVKSDFLILDEPFSSLDATLKQSSISLVKRILEKEKCSTLFISHDNREIESLAEAIFFIKEGRLIPHENKNQV